MSAPSWVEAAVAQFGQAAGLDNLSLESNSAALRFDNGLSLRFEYHYGELVMAMCMPGVSDVRRLLSLAHPDTPFGFRVRAGIIAKSDAAVIAIRMAERDVTLVKLNAAFSLLWRLAEETGGVQWT